MEEMSDDETYVVAFTGATCRFDLEYIVEVEPSLVQMGNQYVFTECETLPWNPDGLYWTLWYKSGQG